MELLECWVICCLCFSCVLFFLLRNEKKMSQIRLLPLFDWNNQHNTYYLTKWFIAKFPGKITENLTWYLWLLGLFTWWQLRNVLVKLMLCHVTHLFLVYYMKSYHKPRTKLIWNHTLCLIKEPHPGYKMNLVLWCPCLIRIYNHYKLTFYPMPGYFMQPAGINDTSFVVVSRKPKRIYETSYIV